MTRWQKIILVSLSLIVLTMLVMLAYVLLTVPTSDELPPTPVPKPTYTVPAAAVTARSAYEQAQAAAQAWQADALLVSASAVWRKTSVAVLSWPVAWNYQFYSPGTKKIYLIVVRDGQASGIRETLSPYKLATVNIDQWQVDSHQALSAWLNGGGGGFMRQYTLIDIQAKLSMQQDKLLWIISGTNALGTEGLDVVVEAATP